MKLMTLVGGEELWGVAKMGLVAYIDKALPTIRRTPDYCCGVVTREKDVSSRE